MFIEKIIPSLCKNLNFLEKLFWDFFALCDINKIFLPLGHDIPYDPNELVEKIRSDFKIVISKLTVNRILKQFHYSLKRLVPVPMVRNTPNKIETSVLYSIWFKNIRNTRRD